MNEKNMIDAYSEVLSTLFLENEKIVLIDCDLSKACGTSMFDFGIEQRHINLGICEQNAVSVAGGLASEGYISLLNTFSVFASTRALDQLRNSVCYPNQNVKIIGVKAGVSDSYGGATHQAIDDIGIISTIPNIVIMEPSDPNELKNCLKEAIDYFGPVYIRIHKMNLKCREPKKYRIGKGELISEGKDLCIISAGDQLTNCLWVTEQLNKNDYSIQLINMSSIKPLDKSLIIESAKKTKAILVVQTHNVLNGLGNHVARITSEEYPVKVKILGIQDTFTESGSYDEILEKNNISKEQIYNEAIKLLEVKN